MSKSIGAPGTYLRLPRLLIAALMVWSIAGWVVAVLAPLCSKTSGAADVGIIATVRTTVVAATALAIAWAGRHDRFRESAWLLYPVLIGGGLKLFVEDIPRSRPATLFLALALYGSALIITPRLGRAPRLGGHLAP